MEYSHKIRLILLCILLLIADNILSQPVVIVKVKKPVLEDTVINLLPPDLTGMRATYGGRSTGNIAMKNLYHDGLVIFQGGVYEEVTILSFRMTVRTNRTDMVQIAVNGSKLNDRMKALLRTLKPDDYLYFDTIKVRLANGVVRNFKAIALRVVQPKASKKHLRL